MVIVKILVVLADFCRTPVQIFCTKNTFGKKFKFRAGQSLNGNKRADFLYFLFIKFCEKIQLIIGLPNISFANKGLVGLMQD